MPMSVTVTPTPDPEQQQRKLQGAPANREPSTKNTYIKEK